MKKQACYKGAAAAAVVIGMSFGTGVGPAEASRTVTARYTAPGFVVALNQGLTGPGIVCGGDPLLGPDLGEIGVACTDPLPGETTVDFRIDDDLFGAAVPARYTFQSGTSGTVEGYFCGSVSGVPIPPGTDFMRVYAVAQVAGGPCANDATATTGTITIDVS